MKKLRKAYIALIMAFLYAPILLLILYSFNDSKSRANWGGFTLRWYKELFSDAAIMSALGTTLSIGLLAAVFSTLLGTVGAIALYQMKRGPRKALLSIVNLPMLNSEVVTGVSLMLLYAMVNIQLGYLTLLLSHIAFCVPYVVLSVMPKLRQLDPNLAEAAQLIEASKVREGDVLVAFDDFLEGPHGSGKLMVWEADQLVNVEKNDWESPALNPYWRETVTLPDGSTVSRPCFQDQGVVTNRRGKVLAYIVTSRHVADERRGYLALPISEVLVLPVRCCRLVKRRFRFGQRRGVPNLLNVAEDLADIDEMIKSELATAAVRAKLMAIVKHSSENANAEQDVQLEKMLAAVSGKGSAADTPTPEPKQLKTYKNIESVTGGCSV